MNLTNPIFLVIPHHIPEQTCDHLIFLQILIMFHLLEQPCSPRKERIALKEKFGLHFSFSLSVWALSFYGTCLQKCSYFCVCVCVCVKALPIKCQNEKKLQFWYTVTASSGSSALLHWYCGQIGNVNIIEWAEGWMGSNNWYGLMQMAEDWWTVNTVPCLTFLPI